MSEDARLIPLDGQDTPMSESELAAYISESGNPTMLGDWFTKRVDKSPDHASNDTVTGRVSIDMAAYLDAFSPGELEGRIKVFKDKLADASDVDAVRRLVMDTLTPAGWRSVVRAFSTVRIPAWSTYLYRVRPKLNSVDDIRTVGDIWTPPTGTSSGRVNRSGQPILYTSAEWPAVAHRESGAELGEIVALSCFAVTDDLELLNLDDMDPQWALNISQQRKWAKLAEFYRWAFRHSGIATGNPAHLLPQVLTLDFNMLIPPLVGYGYRSVLVDSPEAINVALDEQQAASRLRLIGTTVWQIGKPKSLLLASLVPRHQSLARSTPLVPGQAIWPARARGSAHSYQAESRRIEKSLAGPGCS